jgi:ubiquinone/menaquinone biosynthesis C-methylase UbiE
MPKLMAMFYDRTMKGVERAGVAAWRADLLRDVEGEVLELGAGTGANLSYYGGGVTRLVLTEPDPHMRRLLEQHAEASPLPIEVVDAPAETLPFPDGSFDVVVATLVFCSVADPSASLREVHRVLRPGGRYVYLEHVAAGAGTTRRKWQGRIEPIWKRVAGNCHLTRETAAAIRAAGFELERLDEASMRKAPPIVRPTIRGVAVRR